MKKVLVYMATYNGEKYLAEQLDSLLQQENVCVDIMVADDGSQDATVAILNDYAARYSNIKVLVNPVNLGYKKNFLTLIQREVADTYDYFALSDQDDVWLPDKLSQAVMWMDENCKDPSLPCAYSSNLTLVDETLQPYGLLNSPKEIKKFSNENMLLENKCTGCTLVFNGALREQLLRFPVEKIASPHDDLICKIAILLGEYHFDERSAILYRQHGNNQIGANKSGKIKKYFALMFGKRKSAHSQSIRDILECYPEAQSSQYFKYVRRIAYYKSKFSCRMKIFFSRKYKKISFQKTVVFKIAILFGKY